MTEAMKELVAPELVSLCLIIADNEAKIANNKAIVADKDAEIARLKQQLLEAAKQNSK